MKSRVIAFLAITLLEGCAVGLSTTEQVELTSYRFPDKICSDAGYIGCYEISEEQCKAELNSINTSCIEEAKDRIGGLSMETKDQYISFYSDCILSEHLEIRRKDHLSQCGQDVAKNFQVESD